jgi:hypothetical protein
MTTMSSGAWAVRRDLRKTLLFGAAVTAVCLIQLGLSIWRTRNTYFILDDFLNFIIFRDMGLTWHYVFRDLFGHVTPLYRMAQAAFLTLNGLHFAAARAIIVAVALIPTTMLMLIGRRLAVPLPVSAAGALLVGCLPQLGQAEFWWSNALLVVPGLAAFFVSLWLLVGRQGEGPSEIDAALAGFVFAAGLGFYDKNLFAVVPLFGVLVSIRWKELPLPGAMSRGIFDLRYILPVAVAWAVALLFLRDVSPRAPDLGAATRFIWLAWSDAILGALFGMGSSGFQSASPALLLLVPHALLTLFVVYTFRQGGLRILPIWIGVLSYIGATLILTARMRAGPFGAEFGRTLRYAVEPAAFIVVAVVLALAGTSLRRSWVPAASMAAMAAWVVIMVDIPPIGEPKAARQFVSNVRQSIARNDFLPGLTVLDAPLPEEIMATWTAPLNVPSEFLPLIAPHVFAFATGKTATIKLSSSGMLIPLAAESDPPSPR